MTDFATLVMSVDATGLKAGEQALDRLATKGAQAEAKVTSATSNVSKRMNEVGTASDATRNRMRLLGQQLGQVTQQAAAGGNVIGALGMQLGDILPMLGVGGVAGIGLTIAGIIAPMAASMIDLSGGTKTAKDAFDDLADAVDDVSSAQKDASASVDELVEKYGNLWQVAQGSAKAMLNIKYTDAITALDKAIDASANNFTKWVGTVDNGGVLTRNALKLLAAQYDLTTQQAYALNAASNAYNAAQGPEDQAEAAAEYANQLSAVYGEYSKMPPEVQAIYKSLQDVVKQAGLLANIDPSTGIAKAQAAALALTGQLLGAVDALNLLNRAAVSGGLQSGRGDGMAEWSRRNQDLVGAGREELAPSGSDLAKQIDAVLNPKTTTTTKTKKASTKQNRYESALTDITGDTAAMQASLDLYKTWDGTLDGLNRQIAITAKQQDLLNRAQQAGQKITPELTQQTLAAATAYVDTSNALQKVQDEAAAGQDAMKSLFGSLVGGADDAKSAVISLLEQIAQVQAYKGLMGLLGGSGSTAASFIGSLLSYDGGGYTGSGSRSGGIDGKGGSLAIVHPQETIIDHTKSGSGVSGTNSLSMSASSLTLSDDGKIMATVTAQMANMLTGYDKTMPDRVKQISNNPRKR